MNSPISTQNAKAAIKELNDVIYNYFCTKYGPVNSNNISSFVLKYRDMNAKELKRNLRILKQSGAGLEEITFVSRRLRQILKSGGKDDNRINSGIDHDSHIKDNFWGYVKRIVKSKANTLPSFTETECISYFKSTFSALSSNKLFNIPTWIPQFAPPQMPFNSDPPSYHQVSKVIRKMKSSGSPSPLYQISILCFKRCPYLRSHLTEIIRAVGYLVKFLAIGKKHALFLYTKQVLLMILQITVRLPWSQFLSRSSLPASEILSTISLFRTFT